MPRKKKTPVVTPAIDLPQEFLEKLIPGFACASLSDLRVVSSHT